MYNLILSLAAGIVVGLAVRFGAGTGWAAAVVPGVIAAVAAYLVLVRRTFRQLEQLFGRVQAEIQAQKFERAIQVLQGGFALAPWQFLVAAQVHSQIGVLHYVRKEYDKALPHLEKSFSRHWVARGMLGAQRWRMKDVAGMEKVLGQAVKDNKKEGTLWVLYAWLLDKEGRGEEAVAVLGRGVAANPSDEKLKAALQALQNDKKLKPGKLYAEAWYQFMLEPPPTMQPFGGGGGMMRGSRRAIYGRR